MAAMGYTIESMVAKSSFTMDKISYEPRLVKGEGGEELLSKSLALEN